MPEKAEKVVLSFWDVLRLIVAIPLGCLCLFAGYKWIQAMDYDKKWHASYHQVLLQDGRTDDCLVESYRLTCKKIGEIRNPTNFQVKE